MVLTMHNSNLSFHDGPRREDMGEDNTQGEK